MAVVWTCVRRAALIALLCWAAPGRAAESVGALRYSAADKDALRRAARLQLPSLRATLSHPAEHRLAPLSGDELPRQVPDDKPPVVGVHRRLAADTSAEGRWETLPGGRQIWRLAIHSPEAAGLRLHFTGFSVGTGRVWIHDGSEQESEIQGPYTGTGPWGDGDFWSDFVLAETILVEFEPERPASAGQPPPFRIAEVSHLLPSALPLSSPATRSAAASCNLDVSCYPEWAETAKSVGHIVYEEDGNAYVCSGTLLNTRNSSGIPYFLTANHCVNTDPVARTVQAFWSYQTQSCNGPAVTRREAIRTLGARFMAGGESVRGDFSLLRLNEVPSGVVLSGWQTQEVAEGTSLAGIHHPAGDYKRIWFGTRASGRPPFGADPDAFLTVEGVSGIVQKGSSGSGVFSAPSALVGVLSHGPKIEDQEQLCAVSPLRVNYGKFSNAYPVLRDFLEDRATVTTAAPPPPGGPTVLTSGVAQNFTLGPVSGGTVFTGNRSYTIAVPQGATRLEIRLLTYTPFVDVDLFARFGADTAVSAGSVVADHRSEGPGGDETITVTASSSPPLRAGTYYISLALFTSGATVSGALTATVTAGAPPAGGPVTLTSGTPQSFSIPAVSSAVLLTGSRAYQISVPQGATRLDVRLTTATPGVDLDLFVRYGSEPTVSAGRVLADYDSSGPAGEESISITPNSTPPLRPGTYYIALAVFTAGVSASGTLTATVTTGAAPGAGPIALTSGVAQNFTFAPVFSPVLMNGTRSYVINVPQGAARLEIQLSTATADVDIDLFARYGSDLSVASGRVVADHSSTGPAGNESITITATSSPPLRAGTYYIALALFTTNVTASGTVRATVSMSAPPPAPAGPTVLTSGRPQNFTIGPYSNPTLLFGPNSYVVDVPQGATRLDVQLVTATAGVDVDLFARYGTDTTVSEGNVVADHSSTGPTGGESITITGSSSPPLRPGRYYLSLAIYTTGVAASGTLTATVSTAAAPVPAPTTTTALTSGVPAKFNLPAVEEPTLFVGAYSYRITVPEGASSLKVQLASAVPAIDVDLYVRYESDVDLSADGEVLADYGSEGETGNEVLTIGAGSNPPLRPGTYYIALALYTTGTASSGTVTATVERPSIAPPVSATRPLVSGVPAQFSLPAVDRPTFFSGDYGFRITVPSGSGKLEISLRTETAGADVDLFVRFGAEPDLAEGRIVADHRSISETGEEYLVIQPLSVPPLRPGVYFIAVALYTTGVATQGTITATVTPAGAAGVQGLFKPESLDAPPGLPLEGKRGWAVEIPIPALSKQEMPAEVFKQSDRPVKKTSPSSILR